MTSKTSPDEDKRFIVNFVTCKENMPWVVQRYGDGCDYLIKDMKMCMMICGVVNRLWWMKIWCVHLNRRLDRTDNSSLFHFPFIFLKFQSHLQEIVSDKLQFWKLCACWVPKMLTKEHKLKRQASTLDFLTWYTEKGDNFLSCVVTGDETRVWHTTHESKQQSTQWRHTSSPTKTKFKQTTSTWKIMCTVFWNSKGVLRVDFLLQGFTINTDV
jgi:hypothetical protein